MMLLQQHILTISLTETQITETPLDVIWAISIVAGPRRVFIHADKQRVINIKPVKTLLIKKSKEGLRGGSSTSDNKVKVITVPAAANKSHIIAAATNTLTDSRRLLEDLAYLSDLRIYFYV